MLIIVLSMFFSVMSAGIMAYLTMNSQIGPWFAPIFVVLGVMLLSLIISTKHFLENRLFVIAAGSIGGMVGVCLGSTVPVLYFLQPKLFFSWELVPLSFCFIVGLFVACASFCSFAFVYMFRSYLFADKRLSFPMSQFFYDLLYSENIIDRHRLILIGFLGSAVWQMFCFLLGLLMRVTFLRIQVIPFMLTIGFLSGWISMLPIVWGIGLQYFVVWFVPRYISSSAVHGQIAVTVVIGMLLAWLLYEVVIFAFQHLKESRKFFVEDVQKYWNIFMNYKQLVILALSLAIIFKIYSIPVYLVSYIVLATLFLTYIISRFIGEVGVVDAPSFASILLFPLMFMVKLSAFWLLMVAIMSLLIFGIVIDLLFSSKIAELARVEYRKVLLFQLFGCLVSACCVGFILWWYMYKFGLHKNDMVYSNSLQLSEFIKYQVYDYKVFYLGLLIGFILLFLGQDLLSIAGAILLNPALGIALIGAGYVSSCVKKPDAWYPAWFGFYAGHSVLLLIKGLIA